METLGNRQQSQRLLDETRFQAEVKKAVIYLAKASPELKVWMKQCGPCGLQVAWQQSVHESLVRAVAHQQLHGKAAAMILERLKGGFRGHAFPSPRQLARAPLEKLRGMGLSNAKAVAIKGISAAVERGDIPDRSVALACSNEALIKQISTLRGVGAWTVEMLLIFTLGRLDVMPVDDYGVRSGLRHLFLLDELPNKKQGQILTSTWSPYRSVAAWYLWRKAEACKGVSAALNTQ